MEERKKDACSLCSNMRRGYLPDGQGKQAQTCCARHHKDDAVETVLLNLFYGGVQVLAPTMFMSRTEIR